MREVMITTGRTAPPLPDRRLTPPPGPPAPPCRSPPLAGKQARCDLPGSFLTTFFFCSTLIENLAPRGPPDPDLVAHGTQTRTAARKKLHQTDRQGPVRRRQAQDRGTAQQGGLHHRHLEDQGGQEEDRRATRAHPVGERCHRTRHHRQLPQPDAQLHHGLHRAGAPSQEALALLPYETARQFMAFPCAWPATPCSSTPRRPPTRSRSSSFLEHRQRELTVCVSTAKDIIDAYRKYYGISDEEYHSFFTFESREGRDHRHQVEDFGALVSDAADEFEIESGGADEGAPTSSSPPRTRRSSSWSTAFWSRRCRMGSTTSSRSKRPCRSATASGSLFKSMNLPLTIKNAWPRA